VTDSQLYDLWYDASHSVGQPQCHYPQIDTLRKFYQRAYEHGQVDAIQEPPTT